MAQALLRLPQVQARVGLSRSALYARIASGEFPKPVGLGVRAVAWPSDEIDAWIASRIGFARKGGQPMAEAA